MSLEEMVELVRIFHKNDYDCTEEKYKSKTEHKAEVMERAIRTIDRKFGKQRSKLQIQKRWSDLKTREKDQMQRIRDIIKKKEQSRKRRDTRDVGTRGTGSPAASATTVEPQSQPQPQPSPGRSTPGPSSPPQGQAAADLEEDILFLDETTTSAQDSELPVLAVDTAEDSQWRARYIRDLMGYRSKIRRMKEELECVEQDIVNKIHDAQQHQS